MTFFESRKKAVPQSIAFFLCYKSIKILCKKEFFLNFAQHYVKIKSLLT